MQYHWIVALIFSSTITSSILSIPPLEGEPPRYRSERYMRELEIEKEREASKANSHNDPYYLESAVIDIEKMLENDPELRERYDSLTKEERREFIETLSSFNEVFQQAFEALMPDDQAE